MVVFALNSFGVGAGGWSSDDLYPRRIGDVNLDGRDDIVGFGQDGVYVALGSANGTFGGVQFVLANFGAGAAAGGWSGYDQYPREVGDVNGDGREDIVGFGQAGVYVSLGAAGGGFGAAPLALGNFGAGASAGGWTEYDLYPRKLSDVNGDGRDDIIGFGQAGVYVALAGVGGTYGAVQLALGAFGAGDAAGGWSSNDQFLRDLGDVNGDGRADIVGFGQDGIYVSFGTATGAFGGVQFALANFGAGAAAGGWSSDDLYPRRIADVNGDGRDDIVGFGDAGVYVALAGVGGTFGAVQFALAGFGAGASAGGWNENDTYPRELGDVNGDGRADIVGFGQDGVYVAFGTASGTFI